MTQYLRAFCERSADDVGDGAGPLRFTASTEGVKRDGKNLRAEEWDLDNYRRNPVVLWVHDYMGRNLPIGRADVRVDGGRLVADVIFDSEDEFARQVEGKYRRGFLNAVSVGWGDEGERNELLDISAVPVPADPDALIERERRALTDLNIDIAAILHRNEERKAIPPHSTDKAPEDAAWDGPAEVAKADATESVLRRMHTWVDEDADPDTKRAYKLPHHLASGEVVWRGVAAAMARLLQAGTQIPDGDRRGVYNHLRRHYEQFDREPPEFRSNEELAALGMAEIRGLFLEGESEMFPELFAEERAGAVLNARNRQDLKRAVELIRGVLQRATKENSDEERADTDEPPEWLAGLYESLARIEIGDNNHD